MNTRMKKFKLGDQVIVTGGKDKGRTGEISRLLPPDRVVIKGINLYKRHLKPRGQEPGGIKEQERPLPTANIMHVEDGKPIRVGLKRSAKLSTRVSKKTGKTI